jgi:hypothetical protein
MPSKDSFFDSFDEEIEVDWSKVSMQRIEKMYAKLSTQDADKIFGQLKNVIDENNKKKAIINATFAVLQVVVKLGLKVI